MQIDSGDNAGHGRNRAATGGNQVPHPGPGQGRRLRSQHGGSFAPWHQQPAPRHGQGAWRRVGCRGAQAPSSPPGAASGDRSGSGAMLTDSMTDTQFAGLMIAALAIAEALLITIIVWPFSGLRKARESNWCEGPDTV